MTRQPLQLVDGDRVPGVRRNYTDLGNAERLADRHGADLRYCADWKSWLVWDGARFQRDNTDELMRRISDTAAAARAEERFFEGDEDKIKQVRANAKAMESVKGATGALRFARSLQQIAISPDQLDADPWLLNTPGGTVDLRTGELLPHTRGHLITKCTIGSITRSIDPLTPAPCPTWRRHLEMVTAGDKELQRWMQMAAGYSLTGSTREQCLFVLYGTGRNGKSKFVDALEHTMGDYALSTPTDTLMVRERGGGIPNDIARLRGARFVSASEADDGGRLSEALVKRLTGGDTMVARFLNAEFFEFRPELKIWLSVNHRPVIYGTDDGIWRRMRLVPFTVKIPEAQQDPDILDKFKAEADGILAWAVEGALAWQAQPGGLGMAASVVSATAEYRREMDVVGRFLEERCIFRDDLTVSAMDLYRAYSAWAKAEGQGVYSNTRFGSEMRDRGYPSKAWGKERRKHHFGVGLLVTQSAL